jgi:hypothetical protein
MNQLSLNGATRKMRKAVHQRLTELDGVKLDDVWLGLRVYDPDVTDKDIQNEIQRSLIDRKKAHWLRKLLSYLLPRISGKRPLR